LRWRREISGEDWMDLEVLLVAVALTLVLIPVVRSTHSRSVKILCVSVWLVLSSGIVWSAIEYRRPRAAEAQRVVTNRPIEVPEDDYVSSDTCRSCHAQQYAMWRDSYHSRMTQVASPESVIGHFEDVELAFQGRSYRLERRGDEFWVDMEDPKINYPLEQRGLEFWEVVPEDAPRVEQQVLMTTGSHHFQGYHFPSGQTRKVNLFGFLFRIEEQIWMPIHSAFLVPPDLRVGLEARWNLSCNKCHSTQAKPYLVSETEMNTQAMEFGIACESCHGPAEEHIRVNGDPQRRYQYHLSGDSDPTIVNPKKLSSRRSAQVCGQCHAVSRPNKEAGYLERPQDGDLYRPGDELTETRRLRTKGESRFWPDGMVRVGGREYNALDRSPCFMHGDEQRGVITCLDCHRMHKADDDPRPIEEWANDQLKSEMDGNQACTQCHSDFENQERVTSHTHHVADSSGSLCYNCHMPHTAYGLLKATRSHQIDNPSVAASLKTGRPNACNLCHLDKTLQWTSEHLSAWYRPEVLREGKGLTDDEKSVAASILWLLSGDASQRALIAWSMDWKSAREASGENWMAPYLGQLLEDPYDAVRFIAYRSLRSQPGFSDLTNDFRLPPEERAEQVRKVNEIWASQSAQIEHSSGEPILINTDGSLQWDVFRRLLVKRDETRVFLGE
jgi:hypothetical protein